MQKNLLLISNSSDPNNKYLGSHCEGLLKTTLADVEHVLFIPWAQPQGIPYNAYTALVRERFQELGKDLTSIHETNEILVALGKAQSIFIGGGNTFSLQSKLLNTFGAIPAIRKRVLQDGIPYIGSSAGINVVCPTIKTTNDMPIVLPHSFESLNFVPFQINPHYVEPEEGSKHKGETRADRINEFHATEDNEHRDLLVIGLYEMSSLVVKGKAMEVKGPLNSQGVVVFEQGKKPSRFPVDTDLSFLLRT
tara:strand:- start:17204 stop:17953 length:750 start_codon:yes stop_codon:yes gene_type:complete